MAKSFEYNSIVESLRSQYGELMRRMLRVLRDENEFRDEILERRIGRHACKVIYGREIHDDDQSNEEDKWQIAQWADEDETNIYQMRYWNEQATNRVKDMFIWQKLVLLMRVAMQPKTQVELAVASNPAEIEMQCSICFVTDFDNLN